MVRKLGKVLCCVFLITILRVDLAKSLAKYTRLLCVLIHVTTRSVAIMSFMDSQLS